MRIIRVKNRVEIGDGEIDNGGNRVENRGW